MWIKVDGSIIGTCDSCKTCEPLKVPIQKGVLVARGIDHSGTDYSADHLCSAWLWHRPTRLSANNVSRRDVVEDVIEWHIHLEKIVRCRRGVDRLHGEVDARSLARSKLARSKDRRDDGHHPGELDGRMSFHGDSRLVTT